MSPSNRLSSERFSFHLVSDTEVICDKDGVELLLHDGVLTCAARAIEELRQDGFFAAEAWQGRQIEITDCSGRTVLSVPLHCSGMEWRPLAVH